MSHRVDELANDNIADQDSGEEICQVDNKADRLSVMFPACQDPLLAKIYQGLPALPCVALFCLVYRE